MPDGQQQERREVPRFQFIASAEETDLESGTRLAGRVSELSKKGCYIDTLNPFSEGTKIRITISHGSSSFTAIARVIYALPNMGMGIAFNSTTPDQLEVLKKWLEEVGAS